MIKNLLSIAFTLALAYVATAQCTPDPNHSDVLVYPSNDSTFNLIANQAFDGLITLNVPSDTSVGPLTAVIDSVVLGSVVGLPAGLTYECNNSECLVLGGESGCFRMFGTPVQEGTFVLEIEAVIYTSVLPLTESFEYDLVVSGPTSLNAMNQETELLTVFPNPAKDLVNVSLTEPNVTLSVYDITGSEVHQIISTQEKMIQLDVSSWNAGVYFLKYQSANNTAQTTFTVMH